MSDPEKTTPEKPGQNREIVFHYSREHRLDRASGAVRDLNENAWSRPKLFGTIFGNRGNIIILITIVVICAMSYISSRYFGQSDSEFKFGNNTITISVYYEEDILFLSLRKVVPAGAYAYTGAVDIAVSPVQPNGESQPIQTHRIFFSLETTEN